jgi:hypothetical protein
MYAFQQRARNFTHFTNKECIDAFLYSRNANSELVMVSSTVTGQNVRNGIEFSLIEGFISGMDHDRWDAATNWVCDHNSANTKELAMPSSDHWIVRGQQIQYCLVGLSETMTGDVGHTLARRFSVPPEVGKKYLQPMPVDKRDGWGWLMEDLEWVVPTGPSVVVKLRRRA